MNLQELTPDWPATLAELMRSLEIRLARGITTTEDTARYYLFMWLTKAGFEPEAIILERPHPRLQGRQIDLSVITPDGTWDFEMKYHRPIPSGQNRPFTQLRGQLVSDLYKLALSDGQRRYLLYLADPDMAAHLRRQMDVPAEASRASPLQLTPEWFRRQPKTLRDVVQGGLGSWPERMALHVWTKASWSGALLDAWLFEVDNAS